jgi:putative ABC transport system permease protein
MRRIRIFMRRIQSVFLRNQEEERLQQEIEIHFEQLIRELMASGLSRADATQEARRQFGPVQFAQEECRDMRKVQVLENLARDVVFAVRMLRKSPGFTITAIASLVLGIGANTAMFQLFEAVRLRSLPVERPEQLVTIRIRGEGRSGNFRGRNGQFTNAMWTELQKRQTSLAGVFAYGDTRFNLSPNGEIRNAEGMWVSGTLFPVLGVRPFIGRLISPEDDRPGCGSPGAVISHGFWQREFGSDPGVLSRTLPVDGRAVPILGVTPPEFFGVEVGRRFDIAMPICANEPRDLANRVFYFLAVMGRLREAGTEDAVKAELQSIAPGIFEATLPPDLQGDQQTLYKSMQLTVGTGSGGQSEFRDTLEKPLTYLLCMVVLVLVLACANLANMMLARATAREHEFAVRRSMGASRWRLIHQVLIESLLLATAGAAIGAIISAPLGRAVISLLTTARDPVFLGMDFNGRVLGFTIAAAFAATLLFGLAPALRAAQTSSRGSSDRREARSFRRALLIAQVALSMVLLTAALLFSKSYYNLLNTSPGFNPQGVLLSYVFLDAKRYPPEGRAQAIEDLHNRVAALPGVNAVARNMVVPIGGNSSDTSARVSPNDPERDANLCAISEGYFNVMRMPLLAGRDFTTSDRRGTKPVAVVNQAFARIFFNGQNPVGRTFYTGRSGPPYEVVGLTGDSKYLALAEPFAPIVYLADRQREVADTRVRFLIRVSGKPEALIASVKQTLLAADPTLNMRFIGFETQIEQSVKRERLMAALTGAFGFLGLLLALTGVFGVTAYVVSRRFREFGVRIAMGATRYRIIHLVLGELTSSLFIGIAIGTVLAVAAGTVTSSILFGVKPHDVLTLVVVSFVLATGGLLAGCLPAIRASRVAPIEALRLE